MRILPLFIALCFFIELYAQTTVIAVVKQDTIFVAADSREKVVLRRPGMLDAIMKTDTACKIRTTKTFCFAIQGSFAELSLPLSYKYLQKETDVLNASADFAQELTISIASTLQSERKKGLYIQPDEATGIIWFGFLEGRMLCWLHSFQIKNSRDSLKIVPSVTPITGVSAIGFVNGIEEDLRRIGNNWSGNIPDTLVHLIKKQEAATPEVVGGNVDVIMVTRSGEKKWIYRKQNCN